MLSRATIWAVLQLPRFSTSNYEACGNCLGLTCAGARDLLGCEKTCLCTPRRNLFCSNGDFHAYCSCFKAEEVGIGDVVAANPTTRFMSSIVL